MKVSKNFLVALALGIVACALGGCGFIKKPMTSEATLLDRAEMATGVENRTYQSCLIQCEARSTPCTIRSEAKTATSIAATSPPLWWSILTHFAQKSAAQKAQKAPKIVRKVPNRA